MKYINYFSILLVVVITGCTKETFNQLVYPTTFRFNSPALDDRAVFTIDNTNTMFMKIIDELGSFDRSDASISDTINHMIRAEFANNMISEITLLSASDMVITRGRLALDPNNPLKDTIIVQNIDTVRYQINGNYLMPGMYLNNENRDIYICNEFIYANARISTDSLYFAYYRNDCNGRNYETTLRRFIDNNNFLKFDTASVEYVNYIFSSYK